MKTRQIFIFTTGIALSRISLRRHHHQCILLLLLFCTSTIHSFTLPYSKGGTRVISTTQLEVGNLFGGGGGSTAPQQQKSSTELPRDVKDAVSKCRAAVQQALGDRCSRMDIEMPVGTKFGVEQQKTGNKKNKKASSLSSSSMADGAPTQDTLEQSNRELARLFVDMFQPVGGDNIAVVFRDQGLADGAKQKWKGDPTANSRILAIDRKKGAAAAAKKQNKKKSKGMGFAAKLAAEIDGSESDDGVPSGPFALPENTEVAIFVAPGPKELIAVERICKQVGMGTLVILLNARLGLLEDKFPSESAEKLFTQEFESVFCLTAAPQEQAPNCLLYRMYPSSWVLARKPKVGPPKPILTQDGDEKPTKEQCQNAFDALEISDVERGVENVLENVAGWFK